jgi:1-deoxy-D-xylulose-5-phosphate synthase
MGGMHPVAAIYATFLNRAFDQVLMDVALHRLPVTFVLDRAGVTGPDGASHHGMWDGSTLQIVPGLRVAVPRDGARVAELLREAVAVSDGPTALRFPGRLAGPDIPAVARLGGMDVLRESADPGRLDVLLLGAGPMAGVCTAAADRLADHGIGVTVVDPRWVKPLDPALAEAARQYALVATVEDNGRVGGFGDAVARLLRDHDIDTPVRTFGLDQAFLEHGERGQVLDAQGLTPQHLARRLTELVARRTPELVVTSDGQPAADEGQPA